MNKFIFIFVVSLLTITGFGCNFNEETQPTEIKKSVSVSATILEAVNTGAELSIIDRDVINPPSDIYKAQIGKVYQLGASNNFILLAFVLQKNMEYPLLDLPAGVETTQGGVIASLDNGETWLPFLTYNNPTSDDGFVVRHNPVGMFVENSSLFVDVADALGAGSGEGQMTRLMLTVDNVWTNVGCYYFVPEVYYEQENGRNSLEVSDDCVFEI